MESPAMAQLDVRFFKPFVEGAINTLQTQCSLPVSSGKPFLKGQRLAQSARASEIRIGNTGDSGGGIDIQ